MCKFSENICKNAADAMKGDGKITISILKPILPGLDKDEFLKNLENSIYDEISNIS